MSDKNDKASKNEEINKRGIKIINKEEVYQQNNKSVLRRVRQKLRME